MYELLIIAYLFQGSTDGGAGVAISHLPFPTKEMCVEAQKNIESDAAFSRAGFGASIGRAITTAKCLKVGALSTASARAGCYARKL